MGVFEGCRGGWFEIGLEAGWRLKEVGGDGCLTGDLPERSVDGIGLYVWPFGCGMRDCGPGVSKGAGNCDVDSGDLEFVNGRSLYSLDACEERGRSSLFGAEWRPGGYDFGDVESCFGLFSGLGEASPCSCEFG